MLSQFVRPGGLEEVANVLSPRPGEPVHGVKILKGQAEIRVLFPAAGAAAVDAQGLDNMRTGGGTVPALSQLAQGDMIAHVLQHGRDDVAAKRSVIVNDKQKIAGGFLPGILITDRTPIGRFTQARRIHTTNAQPVFHEHGAHFRHQIGQGCHRNRIIFGLGAFNDEKDCAYPRLAMAHERKKAQRRLIRFAKDLQGHIHKSTFPHSTRSARANRYVQRATGAPQRSSRATTSARSVA